MEAVKDRRGTKLKTCSVAGCLETGTLISIPKPILTIMIDLYWQEIRWLLWLFIVQPKGKPSNFRICLKHFDGDPRLPKPLPTDKHFIPKRMPTKEGQERIRIAEREVAKLEVPIYVPTMEIPEINFDGAVDQRVPLSSGEIKKFWFKFFDRGADTVLNGKHRVYLVFDGRFIEMLRKDYVSFITNEI